MYNSVHRKNLLEFNSINKLTFPLESIINRQKFGEVPTTSDNEILITV